ncbi:molybdopterin molybdotransferase MoeA [Pacificimonas sp. ICDLI1SI03]
MLSFDQAIGILIGETKPLGMERVPLAKAGRRTLAEPVHAVRDAPDGHRAAMDGFALREIDIKAGIRSFELIGAAYPGLDIAPVMACEKAVRIMTGARMPLGADRVILLEAATEKAGWVRLTSEPPPASHVRTQGSDFEKGMQLLPVGRMIDPRAMVVAAAADVAELTVWHRPRIRVITTGDELAEPGTAAGRTGAVPDSLSEALLLLVRQWGDLPDGSARIGDEREALKSAVAEAVETADIVLIVGGASKGDRDFARTSVEDLHAELHFAGVAMKPGQPVWSASLQNCHLLGLPGNPTAAMTIARLLLAPLILALGGGKPLDALAWKQAPLARSASATSARESFLGAEMVDEGLRLLDGQRASGQMLLARAECLVRRPADAETAPAGNLVDYICF